MAEPTLDARFAAALARHRQGFLDQAAAAYRAVLEAAPEHPECLHYLGMIAYQRGRLDEALALVERSLALAPERPDFLANSASILRRAGRLTEAADAYRRALAGLPGRVEIQANLAGLLKDLGRFDEAETAARQALALDPSHLGAYSNLLLLLNYNPERAPEAVAAEHRRFGARAAELAADAPPSSFAAIDPDPERRLRVGFVSADFRDHACAWFLAPLFTHLDRERIETVCYASVASPDAVTARLRGLVQNWVEALTLDDTGLAQRILADRIDILVDLSGHTAGNRLGVFARRPAPVALTWLGYPNTTGLSAISYRLTDAVADPPGLTEQVHTEKLIRLPGCFLAYVPPLDLPPPGPLPAATNGVVTFGCFNNANKLNPAMVGLWARLLASIPDSRLVLKARQFTDPPTALRYRALFERAGIASGRLEIRPGTPSQQQHLAEYDRIDLALDPFPYNGATTTCEALWMGVPVLTLAGRVHAARVGASLLTAAGLPELVAETPEAFLSLARDLSADRDRLQALRLGMRARLSCSALCDGPGFAAGFAAALRGLWRDWCRPGSASRGTVDGQIPPIS